MRQLPDPADPGTRDLRQRCNLQEGIAAADGRHADLGLKVRIGRGVTRAVYQLEHLGSLRSRSNPRRRAQARVVMCGSGNAYKGAPYDGSEQESDSPGIERVRFAGQDAIVSLNGSGNLREHLYLSIEALRITSPLPIEGRYVRAYIEFPRPESRGEENCRDRKSDHRAPPVWLKGIPSRDEDACNGSDEREEGVHLVVVRFDVVVVESELCLSLLQHDAEGAGLAIIGGSLVLLLPTPQGARSK